MSGRYDIEDVERPLPSRDQVRHLKYTSVISESLGIV